MQTQQMVPRRPMRNRPYDLRKRVLLKNFLRAQNANQNFSLFNLAYFNAAPTFTEENGLAEGDTQESEGADSKRQVESTDNVTPGQELKMYSVESSSQSSSEEAPNASTQENSSKTVSDLKLSGTVENNDLDATVTQEVTHTEVDTSPMVVDSKHSSGLKSSIQSKLTIKKPYTFCRRKSLRDPTKKKARNGIAKAKHSYKPSKSPSKRKFNVRSAFGQMFSRKGSPGAIEDVPYDSRDRREHGNFFAKLFKLKSAKPQSSRSSPTSSDSQVAPNFPATEYNLRSVSRSVQTDFSMCCHGVMFERSAANHFSCENGYCGPEGSTMVHGDRSQPKLSYGNKRRRYSDSSAFYSSSSFTQQKYTDSLSIPKPLQYNSDRYDRNDLHSPRQVTRSRSLSEYPNSVEPLSSRCQRSKSARSRNLAATYSFRSACNQSDNLTETVASSRPLVTRNKDVFSESSLNQRYGLNVQQRPSLLPNPPKQVSPSVFRSASVRENSRNSPLLKKNPILCRRTRSVSDRYNHDRMASYYK